MASIIQEVRKHLKAICATHWITPIRYIVLIGSSNYPGIDGNGCKVLPLRKSFFSLWLGISYPFSHQSCILNSMCSCTTKDIAFKGFQYHKFYIWKNWATESLAVRTLKIRNYLHTWASKHRCFRFLIIPSMLQSGIDGIGLVLGNRISTSSRCPLTAAYMIGIFPSYIVNKKPRSS